MEAAWLARYFPGLGNPFELTLAQWNGLIDRLQDFLEFDRGTDPDDPETLSREIARAKRMKRRRQANGGG